MRFDRHFFDNSPINRIATIRPLEEISNFVTEELPLFLSGSRDTHQAYRQRLSRLTQNLTSEKAHQFIKQDNNNLRIACLDLSILLHASQHLQEVFPVKLYMLLYKIAEKLHRLPIFLYEDCVIFNPLNSDPRLFTTGLTGSTERDFLFIHFHIEQDIEKILNTLIALLQKENQLYQNDLYLAKKYEEMDLLLSSVNSHFLWLGKMSLAEFKNFRELYAVAPSSKHFGPSGRFSETINTLRIITEGKKILEVIPNYFDEIIENYQYYPSISRERMLGMINRIVCGDSRNDTHFCCLAEILAMKHSSQLDFIVARIREFLDKIVNIHYGLTNKYVIRH